MDEMRSEIEQAILLLRRGDPEALEQALALLQNTVFSFSMKVCGQRQDAEDTMQEVPLKSVPRLPKFEPPNGRNSRVSARGRRKWQP